jgi:hypothetical protein
MKKVKVTFKVIGEGTTAIETIVKDLPNEVKVIETHRNLFAIKYPTNWVNAEWGEGSFIAGTRWGQKKDEEKLYNNEITWDEYMNKWHN